ncbi:hypothetical protein [Marinobacter sp.]|uniref:hypothetical protein n=1 Tax=Marinobacter sp. TaxID=50741 RepID=UPI0034A4FC97
MTRPQLATLTAAMLMVPAAYANDSRFEFVGKASEDGTPVYEEHHKVAGECRDNLWHPVTHSVEYRKPGERESFATKSLEYRSSVLRPEMDFKQLDFDESITVRQDGDGSLAIHWQAPSGGTENFSASIEDSVVIDAGFDNLVRRHWADVTSDQSVDFRFLAPTRGEHYAFVMEPVSTDQTEARHTVTIRPSGIVLRFLVDPITLGYDSSGTLTDYIGLSNLRKSEDNNYTVHIRYDVSKRPTCELTP